MQLPESDRARLAAGMPGSVPAVRSDEDDGVAEAKRRSGETDRDPSCCLSHEEFVAAVREGR